MEKNESELRSELTRISIKAYNRGLVGGTGGNISVLINNDFLLITPSGVALCDISVDNIIKVNVKTLESENIGNCLPSKETGLHVEIYNRVPDIKAICHCHPPYATSYAVSKLDIPMVTDAAFKQPPIVHVVFFPSGSKALANEVGKAACSKPNIRTILLDEHGVITLGNDLISAYNTMDLTEELARIAFNASFISRFS